MELQLIKSENSGVFKAYENGVVVGEITFVQTADQVMAFNHTEIYSGFSGRGLGEKMVLKALDYARSEQLKILPLCSFVQYVFDKHPTHKGLLV